MSVVRLTARRGAPERHGSARPEAALAARSPRSPAPRPRRHVRGAVAPRAAAGGARARDARSASGSRRSPGVTGAPTWPSQHAIEAVIAGAGGAGVTALTRRWPRGWWLPAAGGSVLVGAVFSTLAPVAARPDLQRVHAAAGGRDARRRARARRGGRRQGRRGLLGRREPAHDRRQRLRDRARADQADRPVRHAAEQLLARRGPGRRRARARARPPPRRVRGASRSRRSPPRPQRSRSSASAGRSHQQRGTAAALPALALASGFVARADRADRQPPVQGARAARRCVLAASCPTRPRRSSRSSGRSRCRTSPTSTRRGRSPRCCATHPPTGERIGVALGYQRRRALLALEAVTRPRAAARATAELGQVLDVLRGAATSSSCPPSRRSARA